MSKLTKFKKDDICIVEDEVTAVFGYFYIGVEEDGSYFRRTNYERMFAVSNTEVGDGFKYKKVKNENN